MKHILSLILTVAVLVALGSVYASAEPLPDWINPKLCDDAVYMIGSEEEFDMLGDVEIEWDPDAAEKLDLSDSDMQDWVDAGYETTRIDATNMLAWIGDETTYDKDWSMSIYFVSDGEWLYVGFSATDSTFVYGEPNTYNGDAFEMCIDFGGKLGEMLEKNPRRLTNPKNVFYCFSCAEDGAPLTILRQESKNNRHLTEAAGDGIRGTAYVTDTGWNAEFALSLEMLYKDYCQKASVNYPPIYVGGQEELPLTIRCSLYYMDRYYNEEEGRIRSRWVAGASSGRVTGDDGMPIMTYTALDNGVNLILPYREDLHFACEKLVVVHPDEGADGGDQTATVEPATTTVEPATTTAEPATTTTEPVDDAVTTVTESADGGTTTVASTDGGGREGCGSVIGVSAVATLLVAIAAFAIKKKD